MNRFLKYWPFLIIILFGLTPLLWFYKKGDVLINGIDTNFPLDPEIWFMRRFYVWNNVSNAGSDFSSSTAGLFFHFIQVIPFRLGFNLQQVEIISLVFWFSLIVLSSLVLAKTVFEKKPLLWILFTGFYAFNIYLFNAWENVKVANLTLMVAIPLAVAILIKLQSNKISYFKAGIYTIIVGILVSGTGINPAYFLSFCLTYFIFIFADILTHFKKEYLIKSLGNLTFVTFLIITTNLFWILPTFLYIFKNISASGSIDSLGFINWIDSLSFNSSILNIIRLQGAWDWYALDENTKTPFYIPYAATYFSSLPFLFFSFLMPLLALASFLVSTNKKSSLYITFGMMFLVGVFLGAGTHEPTGTLFRFFANHLPFFSLFRSPWYIFSPLLILSLAGLISLFFYQLDDRLQNLRLIKVKRFLPIITVILLISNLIYSYPLWTGKIFRPGREDSFYINIPQYVLEAGEWLESQKTSGRLIGYPDDKIEKFKWGYRGVDSILHLFTGKEVIFSPLNATNTSFISLVDELYKSLKRGEISNVQSLASKLDINTVFEKQDQDSLILSLPENIKALPHRSYGQWVFYDIQQEKNTQKINSPSNMYFSYPYLEGAELLTVLESEDIFLNPGDSIIGGVKGIKGNAGTILVFDNSQAQEFKKNQSSNYVLGLSLKERDLSYVDFTVDIIGEGIYSPILEKYQLEEFGFDLSKPFEVLVNGEKTKWEIEKSSDSYIHFKPAKFTKGKNMIKMSLQNKNLVLNGDFKVNDLGKNVGDEFKIVQENNLNYLAGKNQSDKDIFYNLSLKQFNPLANYLIQVNYKHIYGRSPKIVINQKKGNFVVKKQGEQLPLSPEWDIFSFYYHPHDSNSDLEISLVASFSKSDPLGTKVAYTNVSVQKVFTNNLFLKKQPEKRLVSPNIEFTRVSPVEYQGQVSKVDGDHIISFLENYSPDWEISLFGQNREKLNVLPVHFSANLYANTWYIKGAPENYSFKIFYKPQIVFNTGLAVSLGGAVLILTILLVVKKYGRK